MADVKFTFKFVGLDYNDESISEIVPAVVAARDEMAAGVRDVVASVDELALIGSLSRGLTVEATQSFDGATSQGEAAVVVCLRGLSDITSSLNSEAINAVLEGLKGLADAVELPEGITSVGLIEATAPA